MCMFIASEMIIVYNLLEYLCAAQVEKHQHRRCVKYYLSPQSNLYYFSKEPNSVIGATKKLIHGQIVLRNSVLLGGSQHPLAF